MKKAASCSPLRGKCRFARPALFPGARIPDDALAQMRIVPEELELMRTPEGGLRFAGRLANRTGAPQQVEVRGGDAASPWTSGVIAVPSGGRAAFAVDDFPGSPDAPEARIRGIVHAAGATGGLLHEFTVLLPVKRVLDGMFERLNGKELSYNNLLDLDAAVELLDDQGQVMATVARETHVLADTVRKGHPFVYQVSPPVRAAAVRASAASSCAAPVLT